MPASNRRTLPGQTWRAGGILYLLVLLAALGVGLWPGAIYRPHVATGSPVLPALPCLAVAQVGYLLLAYPLVLWRRRRRAGGDFSWRLTARQSVAMMAAAAPLLLAGAYVSDADWADVVRVEALFVLLWPLAWAAGAGGYSQAARSVVSLAMLVLTAGLAGAWYLAAELVPTVDAAPLWHLGAITLAWDNAARSRGPVLIQPLWPVALYLAAGLAATAAVAISHRSRPAQQTAPPADME